MRLLYLLASSALLAGTTACHSAYIEATVTNALPQPVSLVEVDYPSASFGTQTLLPHQQYHYRFKVLGTGALKLLYTDSSQKEIQTNGPILKEGDEGSLQIVLTTQGVHWDAKVGSRGGG